MITKLTKRDLELIDTIAIVSASADLRSEDITDEIEDRLKIRTASGVYRTAYLLENVVVKVSQEPGRQRELVKEAKFINKMKSHPHYGRHFPHTEVFSVGGVTFQIQEKVDMSHKGVSYEMHDAVENLAEHLGIDDCHSGNYGWAGSKGKRYPVFVDVDFRYSRHRVPNGRKRSWMV